MRKLSIAILGLLSLFAACGGDDDTTAAGGTTTTSASGGSGNTGGMGGGGSSAGESLTFIVVKPAWAQLAPAEYPPVAGATVAFDAPGGERVEAVSGADGKVTFDGIDWSLGEAAATAQHPDHALSSVVGLSAAVVADAHLIEGAFPLLMSDQEEPELEMVQVSGTATNMTDPAHWMMVGAARLTAPSTGWEGHGTEPFSFQVPSGMPFVLQAIEFDYEELPSGQGYDRPIDHFAHMSFDGLTADQSDVVIDFATSSLPTHASETVTMELPTRADSPVRAGWPYTYFCPRNSLFCLGWPTHIDVSSDGNRFEATFLWVEPDWAVEPHSFLNVQDEPGGRFISGVSTADYPATGTLCTFPDVPAWVSPADPEVAHPLHETLDWEVFDDNGSYTVLNITNADQTRLYWQVRVPSSATSLTVPAAPSTVDEAAYLGASERRGDLYTGEYDWEHNAWWSSASPEPITLAP